MSESSPPGEPRLSDEQWRDELLARESLAVPYGEARPYMSVRHRNHGARMLLAFATGVIIGAAALWIIVLIAAAMGEVIG